MFTPIPALKQYFEHLKHKPFTSASKASKRANILAGVCLCLCLILFIQSFKLIWFTHNTNTPLHVINVLVHMACFSTAFFLTKLRYFELARWLLILAYISYLIIAILLWKSDVNIQFYFLLGMFASLNFFHQHEKKQLWITLCVFCGLFIYFQNVFAFSQETYAWQIELIKVNTLALCAACFLLATWIRRQMNRSWQAMQANEQKTRELLLKVIPSHLANYLISAKRLQIEDCINEHAFCSIIFIDFTQFTPFSRQTSDRNLVLFLHRIYSVFDTISEQYNVTKIKTNGDQYIAAIGLESEKMSAYETCQRCCEFALSISKEFELEAGGNIGIKIGIASGNAISGIIGQSRPAFDVWGNTMNLASRLESSAANREIQVCQQTMLYSMQYYQFCSGFSAQLKGLGQLTVYKLLGIK
ncbi:adenylate/guanylate cyclase domain-containing protein [Glaciecola sp. MF2-115]|uniref:adenylate/guanylate cyclase domain-containing protein n=1 Tax=Glaciecola sp. MF2-115 TaxID=3384827 RepID=UPI0039A21AAD